MDLALAPDIGRRVGSLVKQLNLSHIQPQNVVCFRSFNSTSRARARIWSLPKIWQQALKVDAHYCIEVLAEKFDKLSLDDQERVLIHELLHIPKNFSGALLPHRHGRHKTFRQYHDTVERLFHSLRNNAHSSRR